MKKRYRFLLVLALVAIGFSFLWPSIRWYFLVPQADKEIAESSRNRIKEYSQDEAIKAVDRLLALPSGDPLPAEFSYLVAEATDRYRSAGKSACPRRGPWATSSRPGRGGPISRPPSRTTTAPTSPA